MEEYLLQTINLTKTYRKKEVLKQVNIKVKKGSIYGFIGLNGAGKSTLIKIISGLVYPTAGKVHLFGAKNIKTCNLKRRRMGTLIESPALFPNLTATENLEVIRIQRGIPGKACIKDALIKVGLADTGKKKVKKFSLGMKQRLSIASALLNDPELLILDEPINGLDPIGVVEIRGLLKQLNQEYGVTIIISSHILSELHLLATDFGIIHKGVLINQLTAEQLEENSKAYLHLKVDNPGKAVTILENLFKNIDYEVLADESIKLYSQLHSGKQITKSLINGGIHLEQITLANDSLENYFSQLIKEGHHV